MSPQTLGIACLKCGVVNDGHTRPDDPDDRPEDGDLAVCLYCAHLAQFSTMEDGSLGYSELSPEDLAEAMEEPRVRRTLALVRSMNASAPGR